MNREEERELYSEYLDYVKDLSNVDPYLKYIFEKTILDDPDKYQIKNFENMEYSDDIKMGSLKIERKTNKKEE